MSKKLKTTTKNFIVKISIFMILMLIITSVVAFTGETNGKDRTLFANATKGDIENYITEEEKEEKIEESVVIEEEKIPEIIDTIYCVVSGDSYSKICKMFYDNEDLCWALMKWNGAEGNTILYVGQELKIPDLNNEEFAKMIEDTKQTTHQMKQKSVNAETKKEQVMSKTSTETNVVETAAIVEEQPVQQTTTNYSAPTVSGNVRNNPGYVDTSSFTYLGSYRITGYTPGCAHCCGNTKGITASGVPAVIGRTIAAKGFSFGTTLYIKGYGFYVVEDRGGFASGTIDMAAGSHDACYSITNSGVDVYLVSNN